MHLTKLNIQNYRLIMNTCLNVDKTTTLIVGRNNTAKTSCMDFLDTILSGKKLSFDDYPLCLRDRLYENFYKFMKDEIKYDEMLNNIEAPSVEFEIDYSAENENANLGCLSPFIIEVIEDISIVKILVCYNIRLDETAVRKIFSESQSFDENGQKVVEHSLIIEKIKNNFDILFPPTIYAVNPCNTNDRQVKSLSELNDLFPLYTIFAERHLDESGDRKTSSLKGIISKYFAMDIEEFDPSITEKIKKLREQVESANTQVKVASENLLSQLVDKTIDFGYPNAEELELGVQTCINVSNQIQNTAELTYRQPNTCENLPSSYNGLGYKNLLKIEFELAEFATRIKLESNVCIPLLFVEEPESHMHPQLQQAFASYLETFLSKLSNIHIQVLITSHSGHIANTVDFTKIRYSQRTSSGVIYKDLNTFATQENNNISFIKKYLTLSRCDLFFADKAIFVEGASERILLPDMIEKCDKEKLFDAVKYKLPSQYYSIIEICGAYAYIFIPFIKFLCIPCLILTDLDAAIDGRTKAYVSNGKTTTNATIKWWIKSVKKKPDNYFVELSKDIMELAENDKTMGKCHIEYQTTEDGLCGRSLEEAIKNVNRVYYKIDNNTIEDQLDFNDKSKTDFALNLICKNSDYVVPQYIKNGLIWLNSQKVLV